MTSTPDTKNLSMALRLVGVIFAAGIYPLTIIWPSGWRWIPAQPMYLHMILGVYATLGVFLFLAAKDPMRNLSLIWFAVWSSFVPAGLMAYQALTTAGNSGHMLGDVAALAIVGILLAVLTRGSPLRRSTVKMQATPIRIGLVTVILVIGLSLPALLPAQQQDPRPVDNSSARPTQDPPVRAGLPVNNGEGQPYRLPGQDSRANAERPFDTWTIVLPYRMGVTIWARNPSSDPITLTRIRLSNCQNLATTCGTTDLNLVLGPGDSADVITLRPKVWDENFVYRVGWEWGFPADLRATEPGTEDGPHLPFAVWAQTSEERHEVAVMARNTSPDTVVISRVRLSDCENIGIKCGAVRLNLRLAPGDSAATITLRPERWGETLGFHLDWEWTWPTDRR